MRAVLMGLLVSGGLVVSTVVPLPAVAAPPPVTPVAAAADEQAASAAARRQGSAVEAADKTTENSRVLANPDGSFTVEQDVLPVRVRSGSGWVPVDTGLRKAADGSVVPGATAIGVKFSGGGTGPFATMTRGSRSLSWSWPHGALPAPVLDGDTATYPGVLPGVDLKVEVSAAGFRHVLVVRDRVAAADPRLSRLRLGFAATGVSIRTADNGLVQAVDEAGKAVFAAPAPEMWDNPAAKASPSARALVAANPEVVKVKPQRRARLGVEVDRTGLTLVPDRALLADPATEYPVEIDPDWTGYLAGNSWTSVWSNNPNGSYWQRADTSSDTTKGMAKVGVTCNNYNGNASSCTPSTKFTVRSFFKMDTAAVEGKIINSAVFRVEQRHAATCNPVSSAKVWMTGDIGPGTTWNAQPYWNESYTATAPGNRRVDAAYGCLGAGNLEFDVKNMVTAAAGSNDVSTLTIGMRAVNEGELLEWKRYSHTSPQLTVNYNTIPGIPANVDISGKACATGDARAVLGAGVTPRARATVYDPDAGQTITGWLKFHEMNANNGTVGAQIGYHTQDGLLNGQNLDMTLTTGQLQYGDMVVGVGDWDNDGRPDAIVKTPGGHIWAQPITRDAQNVVHLNGGYRIGSGWGEYTIAGIADWDRDGYLDIITRQNTNNELYLYPGQGIMGISQQERVRIGTGWGGLSFAGVADWDLDGKQDVIVADDASGILRIYSGTGTRNADMGAWVYPTPSTIGTGFTARNYTLAGVVDWDRDGKPDLVARDGYHVLWLYPGTGTRSPYTGTPTLHQLGTGFGPMDQPAWIKAVPDVDGDGAADMMGHWGATSANAAWFYHGTGARTPIPGLYQFADVAELADGRRYAWQAAGRDSLGWWGADWSPACEFELDGVPPALPPTVTSTDYPADGEIHGGVGRPGTFTLGAAGQGDVVKYRYGLVTPPTTEVSVAAGASTSVSVSPVRFGLNTLYVESLDRAGNVSARKAYSFNAGSATPPTGQWRMSENGGTSVADSSGNDHPLALQSGATVGNGVATFNGTSSNAAASNVALDTSKSFTVSAWARLGTTNGTGSVLSKDGNTVGSFFLQYRQADDRWTFSMSTADVANNNGAFVKSLAPPTVGAWTHLAAVHDAGAHTISLYVNGVLQGTIPHSPAWNATGPLQVGKYKWWNGTYGSFFNGDIDDVRVWDRVVAADELQTVAAGDTENPALFWEFDDGAGDTVSDSSGNDRSGTLIPSATWTTGNLGAGDGAVRGPVTAGPAVRTDQSYTVTAWAKLDNKQSPAAIVSQAGAQTHGFVLEYVPGTDRWAFTTSTSDTSGASRVSSSSAAAPVVGQWTHLAGVFNAATGKLTLYVNGAPQTSVDYRPTFNTTGQFSVGTAKRDGAVFGRFAGDVDDVRVYTGALPQNLIQLIAAS
ncbi:LamG-like jellyroll fold domain-containing protein [Actinokineospora enzanensis]|uniref:LamG-like jellyroll fold domain-containing protein n=1 Tax=Actinokineospora enzanensis TaxID=155975 RepID=UPI000369D02F|nr:LamG-like jellyroll fold domain-containing protein [Actinokineospora enzanensis]